MGNIANHALDFDLPQHMNSIQELHRQVILEHEQGSQFWRRSSRRRCLQLTGELDPDNRSLLTPFSVLGI